MLVRRRTRSCVTPSLTLGPRSATVSDHASPKVIRWDFIERQFVYVLVLQLSSISLGIFSLHNTSIHFIGRDSITRKIGVAARHALTVNL
jgi:hypothetical protein